MIEVRNLTKTYGQKHAVDNISFTVNENEILGFLGPNGAGKSTTMNIIAGYTSSTAGTVRVNGAEVLEDPLKVKQQIGYLPEHPPLYLDMTVMDYLLFVCGLKKLRGDTAAKKGHIRQIAQLVRIEDVLGRLIKNLSKGYQQRVGLAQALLGNPSVLILDEPTVGLDPQQIIEIRNLIKGLGKKYTIILSSHILSEVQATCERVIVINRGKLVADGSPDNLSRSISGDSRLSLRVAGPQGPVQKSLSKIAHVDSVLVVGQREEEQADNVFDYIVESQPGNDVRRDIFRQLASNNWPLLGLRSTELSLEEIFLRLVSGDDNDPVIAKAEDATAQAEDAAAQADGESEAEAPAATDEPDTTNPEQAEENAGGDAE